METTKPTKCAVYARVSTEGQSVEPQLLDLRRYAKERNWQVKEYVDCVSGAVTSRPQLDKLLDDVRKRRVDTVLVWRFDRMARNVKMLVLLLEEFKSLGVSFVSFQENINTDSPFGSAIYHIISAISALERDTIAERVKSGLRKAREKGIRLGRPKVNLDMKKVKQLRSQGLSLRSIAKQVNASFAVIARAVKTL